MHFLTDNVIMTVHTNATYASSINLATTVNAVSGSNNKYIDNKKWKMNTLH